MKIAFFGLPVAALFLAGDGHEVVWAGICRSRAVGTRRLMRRIGHERVHVVPDASSDAVSADVHGAHPDLVVSWFWTKRIPAHILRLAPSFGVHPSLLPRHRGPDPYFWAIDAGDETTGVTAHVLDEEYDTGAILAQRTLRLDPKWNAWRLARALDRPSLELLRDVTRAFAAGRPLAPHAQAERMATMAPEPTEEDLALQWSWPADRIERRVRAAAPWPGAWTEIGDRIVTLVRVRATRDFPRALGAGEAAVRADGVAVVRAGDDAIELVEGRGEGEGRGECDVPLSSGALARLVDAARTLSIARRPGLGFDSMKIRRL
ncbi:MAG TPA: formyltransferase family protein [Polyangiaceae bacterium]|nr:formyltransferase family protein [Polyangiaceae bacterium]